MAEIRGSGPGSRAKFSLPVKWKQKIYKSGEQERVQFESPGKTVYKTQRKVEKVLAARNMKDYLLLQRSQMNQMLLCGLSFFCADFSKTSISGVQ